MIESRTKRNFNDSQEACARYGMYMWLPDSEEKLLFFDQKIVDKIPIPYDYIWIGVVDLPNGRCLLTDYNTTCPVRRYGLGEPNHNAEVCTHYLKFRGRIAWNDLSCDLKKFAFCQGRYEY